MVYKVVNGLKKGYIAIMQEDGSYDTPIEIGNLIEVSVDTSEDSATLDAGNFIVMTDSAIGETKITVSLPALSDEAKKAIYGYKVGGNGEIIATSDDVKPYFAFQYERTLRTSAGKEISEYVTFYKGQFNLPKADAKTKENGKVNFQTEQIEGTFMPLDDNGHIYMSSVKSDAVGFSSEKLKFGTEITIPTATA